MARPSTHLLVGIATGLGIFAATRRRDLAAITGAASVLIDVDHLVDLGSYRATGRRNRILQPLHAADVASALLVVAAAVGRTRVVALTLGFMIHLIVDALSQRGRWTTLWLINRIRTGFICTIDRAESDDWRDQQVWRWF